MITHQHQAIGCITANEHFSNIHQRAQGYLAAMASQGNTPVVEIADEVNEYSGYQLAGKLLDKGVSAIFACSDIMAFGVYKAAAERGFKIPEDLSVIGFDDINLTHFMLPPLTTITQPTKAIGEHAARQMLEMIETGNLVVPNTVLDIALKTRSSVIMKQS